MERLLTVIVPSYNMEKYLPKCLGSLVVAPELMEKLEVLVVNDGSTDRTSEIAHDFAAKWPRTFQVIDKANGNYGSCINAALPVMTGKFVKVLDADDWFDSGEFARYLEFLEHVLDGRCEAVDLILSDFEFVDQSGKSCRSMSYAFVDEEEFTIRRFNTSAETRLWMHAVAYRTEMLRRIGYRQTEGLSYTDQEWVSIPMEAVRILCRFPGSVYRYLNGRDGQTCSSDTYTKNLWHQMLITEGLVRRYGRVQQSLCSENRAFLHNHLTWRIKLIYSFFFESSLSVRGSDELRRLDRAVCDVLPEIYVELGEMDLSRKFHFYCVKEWREKGTDRTWKFRAFRMARRLQSWLRRRFDG